MGHRPRIVKPTAQQKAHAAVRELYSDIIDNLSCNECDLIIQARIDGLGRAFIVDIITKKRAARINYQNEVAALYHEMKNARA